jgi:chromosome partitioning protein
MGSKLVIIDTPGSHNPGLKGIVAEASLVIAPVIPSPHDLAAIYRTISLAQDAGKPIMFVLNNASSTGKLTKQAVELLRLVTPGRDDKPCIIASRQDFRAAMVGGHTVQELNTKGAQKAAEEIHQLWTEVHSRLKEVGDGEQASAA